MPPISNHSSAPARTLDQPSLRDGVRLPSMADVWGEFPSDTGRLLDAVSRHVAGHAPLRPTWVPHPERVAHDGPSVRPMPHADSAAWLLLKHLVQVALVASALMLVLEGGRSPVLALAWVGTGLLVMGVVAIADRARFLDRDPAFEIIEYVAPPALAAVPEAAPASARTVASHHPHGHLRHPSHGQSPQPALAPLVQQMQSTMPARLDVT